MKKNLPSIIATIIILVAITIISNVKHSGGNEQMKMLANIAEVFGLGIILLIWSRPRINNLRPEEVHENNKAQDIVDVPKE